MNFEICFRSSRRNGKNEKWRLPTRQRLVQYHPLGLHTGHLAEVMNIVTVVIEIADTTGRLHDTSEYYVHRVSLVFVLIRGMACVATEEGIESAQEVQEDGGFDHAEEPHLGRSLTTKWLPDMFLPKN